MNLNQSQSADSSLPEIQNSNKIASSSEIEGGDDQESIIDYGSGDDCYKDMISRGAFKTNLAHIKLVESIHTTSNSNYLTLTL